MKNQFLTNKDDIIAWLDEYEVKNYTLVEAPIYKFVVNVVGNVDLSEKKLQSIPVKFKTIEGYFDCHDNRLTSLEFCPAHISGYFDCSNNHLTSLNGCPHTVGTSFYCNNNQLLSLEFCPQSIGDYFWCESNEALGAMQEVSDFQPIYAEHLKISNIKKEKLCLEESITTKKTNKQESFKI